MHGACGESAYLFQHLAVDLYSSGEELVLVVGAHPLPLDVPCLKETSARGEGVFHSLEVVIVICRQPQSPAGHQNSGYLCQKGRIQEASLVMPFFRPRVREVNVHGSRRVGADEEFDEFPCINPREPDIGEVALETALVGNLEILVCPLDAEEVGLWVPLRGIEEKAALADAQFDLYRVRVAEQFSPVQSWIGPRCVRQFEQS